jgi:NTE family protein
MAKSLTRKDFVFAGAFPGGGALGTFHLGALEALDEFGYELSGVAGDSIGGITAAIYAGNPPQSRTLMLRKFWDIVTIPDKWNPFQTFIPAEWDKNLAFCRVSAFGVPGFFKARTLHPSLAKKGTPEATSFYDTTPLRDTLKQCIDFRYLNSADRPVRCMLGAVNARTGKKVYFDNFRQMLTIDHVIATGALPPAFPGVRINGETWWDGGLGGNVPLDPILQLMRRVNLHVIMPVLFPMVADSEPENIDQVMRRVKELQFCSRSSYKTETLQEQHKLRLALDGLLKSLPSTLAAQLTNFWTLGRSHELVITTIEHTPPDDDTERNDADFRAGQVDQRRRQGYAKMREQLTALEETWSKAS